MIRAVPSRSRIASTTERPVEARSEHTRLLYFPVAGKLQLSRYLDLTEEARRLGVPPGVVDVVDLATVSLAWEDVARHPQVLELLARVVEDWR